MTPITQTDIPKTLNGHPVKAFTIHPDGLTALVLVNREGHRMHPWVTATWWPELADQWQWGNYHGSWEEAETYRAAWIRTKYADHRAAQIEAGTRIVLDGRIGGWQS